MIKRLATVVLMLFILPLLGSLPAHAQSGLLVVNDGEVVTISTSTTVTGIVVNAGGELRFDPGRSVIVTSTANVEIYGKLTIHPLTTTHTLRFVGINEANFVGGGMDVLASDVGLWVMGDGVLDIAGATKTAWTRAAGSIAQNATQIVLESAPVGWRVGDEISIAPTEHPSVGSAFYSGFDLRTIVAINGATITLNGGTSYAHPAVTNPFNGAIYGAEVLNFTRTARIEGTGDGGPLLANNGRSHIFIRSTQPQAISYLAIRHMGPRKVDGQYTLFVTGRYGLHFHHSLDGSRGSLVEGVVIRDTGSHAFVCHASHGCTFQDTISYNTFENAYWWDEPPCSNCPESAVNNSNDISIDHAVAALVRNHPSFRGNKLTGFELGQGNGLTITHSVAVGVQGNTDASGFGWSSHADSVWIFENNIAHNNKIKGFFIWQNNPHDHIVSDSVIYHNETGIDHGAYGNAYQYLDIDLFGNGNVDVRSRASGTRITRPDSYGHVFEHVRMTGTFLISEHNADYAAPTLVKHCVLGGIRVSEQAKSEPGQYDFVNCVKVDGSDIEASDFTIIFAWPSSLYRVQNADGTAYQLTGAGAVTEIEPFYILPLSELAQQVKDILDNNPSVRQELIDAGVIN